MSSLAICRHEHKKWSMFAAANTNGFLLLILRVAFLCSRHLWGNRGATDPDSIHSLWRRSISTLCHAESLIVKSGRKSGLGNPGPQIQSADSLGPPVSTTGILQNYWHWHSLTTPIKCGRALGLGSCSKQKLAKLFLCYAMKQTGRVQRKQTQGNKMFPPI